MERNDDPQVARAHGDRPVLKATLGILAAVYLLAVFMEAAKSGSAARKLKLPASLAYFTQVAALFPHAARHAIDYRVEAYACKEGTWEEIDPLPWFPIDADNKENRFYRAIHFYGDNYPNRQTLRALDEYLTTRYNARNSQKNGMIGGVRFTKVMTPFGDPGEGSARYQRRALRDVPEDQRTVLYYSPQSKREERCKWTAR